MILDTLQSRERHVALLERYERLLTDHQRRVVNLYLRGDLSLAEIAEREGVSRAAVHDLVRRSNQQLEEYERRLGLLAADAVRQQARESLRAEVGDLRKRLGRLEARLETV
jgi:predicted DNA-binding protein YlxM (UPF0122 family)